MNWEPGCLWAIALLIASWVGISYLIFHPPGTEDIPWFVAGASVFIILKFRKQ